MSTAFLSIGSNIDAERNIASAMQELAKTFPGARFSPVYRSAPVGFTGDTFINLVAVIETGLDPLQLKNQLTALEIPLHRPHADRTACRSSYKSKPRGKLVSLLYH